jgi:pimeloyl-ACP methyl ester carboxylesterase
MTPSNAPATGWTPPRSPALSALRTGMKLLARLAPSLAARVAERIMLTPVRPKWPAAERAWLATAKLGTLLTRDLPQPEWNGQPMRTYQWGDGTRGNIVLLHGWGGRATQLHAFIAPLLEQGFRVHAIDMPGHGASAGRQVTIVQGMNALERLLLEVGKVDGLIAHSMGGGIAASVMARMPVGRAVLLAPSLDLVGYSHAVAKALALPEPVRAAVQHRLERRIERSWASLDACHNAASLTLPGLVLHDVADREVPFQAGADLARAWPGATLHTTSGLGHRRILQEPDVVDRCVAFLCA